MVTEITNENFLKEIEMSKETIIVDFYADWCGPCQMLKPIFEQLSNEIKDIKFCKINTQDEPMLAKQFKIRGIPCLIVFKEGKEIDRIVGLLPKDKLKEKIEAYK